MNEINSYVIEDFISKVHAAKKSNQKQITLDTREAQILVDNLALVLSRALGNLDRAQNTSQDNNISVQMDGGSF